MDNDSPNRLEDAHVGASQAMPVKLLTRKGEKVHLRQGLPVRSRARRLALIAPWLAFGLSFGAETGIDVPLTPSLGRKFIVSIFDLIVLRCKKPVIFDLDGMMPDHEIVDPCLLTFLSSS
jgi:hypothetical protein